MIKLASRTVDPHAVGQDPQRHRGVTQLASFLGRLHEKQNSWKGWQRILWWLFLLPIAVACWSAARLHGFRRIAAYVLAVYLGLTYLTVALSPALATPPAVPSASTSRPSPVAPAPIPAQIPAPVPAPIPAPALTSVAAPVQAPAPASPADREAAYAALSASIAHYKDVFRQGQAVVGNTQYATSWDGLAAMNDPGSAAAKLRDYRQNPDPERDLSYMDAFKAADSHFTADNEPQAISNWQDDMATMQSDLSQWVSVAVDYQIKNKSQANLDGAANQVNQDLAKADADANAVRRG